MTGIQPVRFSIKTKFSDPLEPRVLNLELSDLSIVIIDYIIRDGDGHVKAVPRPNQGVPAMIDVTCLAPDEQLILRAKYYAPLPWRSLQITSNLLAFFSFGTLVNDWCLQDLYHNESL